MECLVVKFIAKYRFCRYRCTCKYKMNNDKRERLSLYPFLCSMIFLSYFVTNFHFWLLCDSCIYLILFFYSTLFRLPFPQNYWLSQSLLNFRIVVKYTFNQVFYLAIISLLNTSLQPKSVPSIIIPLLSNVLKLDILS